jgi:murein DD-endopeptidase MepM/ murein hydrolase activator NlpD
MRGRRSALRGRSNAARRIAAAGVALAAVVLSTPAASGATVPGAGAWPVDGPVIGAYDPPESPFGSGHRGIDIAAATGTTVVAPADGTVSFAGPVGGRRFVTIDHGDGLRSTVSFVEALQVRTGDAVTRGQPIASSGTGHAGSAIPHLHFGVRIGDVYQDPLAYLTTPSATAFIRLAPWDEAAPFPFAA